MKRNVIIRVKANGRLNEFDIRTLCWYCHTHVNWCVKYKGMFKTKFVVVREHLNICVFHDAWILCITRNGFIKIPLNLAKWFINSFKHMFSDVFWCSSIFTYICSHLACYYAFVCMALDIHIPTTLYGLQVVYKWRETYSFVLNLCIGHLSNLYRALRSQSNCTMPMEH